MRPALHRLMACSIDYAGLFPPARLELSDAIQNFRAYRSGTEAWLVNRFVLGAAQLEPLGEILAKDSNLEVPLSVVGRASTDRASWEQARAADVREMNAFQSRFGEQAPIEGYEVRLPNNVHFDSWVKDLHGFRDADVFVELPWDDEMRDAIAAAAETEWVNLKARTGGETAEAFPSALSLATFLQAVLQLEVPFKLTAGLHHPLPTHDPVTAATMHGFLNVFTGAALSISGDLSVREWETLLNTTTPESFEFGVHSLKALGMEADLDAIDEARELLLGFGSCSVTEPLEGLTHLGLGTL